MIDTHCHLDHACFAQDISAVWARAQAVGLTGLIIPGVTAAAWDNIRRLCTIHPGLYPAYGLHPMYLAEHYHAHLDRLAHCLDTEPAVAVGESGLDYFIKTLSRTEQQHYFQAHIQLAVDFHLPLILHARRAVDDVLQALRRFTRRGHQLSGVVHSFSGSLQQAQQLIDMGFYLGFGGPITYPRAQRLHRLVKALPAHALLLETDAPDQPLVHHQGTRNEPAFLLDVLIALAQLRNESQPVLEQQTTKNAQALFGLS